MIGEALSHYRIVGKLGEGGMGEVWLAEDSRLDRRVALKLLSGPMERDRIARQRFLREARAAAALDHPFVCKIYEAGEADGKAFIAMEYAEGVPLDQRLEGEPLSLNETVRLGGEIAEALDAAHQRHVVHRDLKPGNVMLTHDGHLKILDFGLAKQLPFGEDDDATVLTGTGMIQGTIGYMSPEQLRGQDVDTRSDIFSFGVLLYEMLAGKAPFDRGSAADTVTAILEQDPPPLTEHRPDVPEVLEQTILRMLLKNADDRFQSVREVRGELQRIGAGDTRVLARVPGTKPRRSWVWLALGAAILIAAAAWLAGQLMPTRLLPTRGAAVAVTALPRLAVLPFDNLSGREEDEAFSDGLTETMITRLARLHGLQVISRSSVMVFKGREGLKASEIAEKLGADYILDGSLFKSGERCRVNVQLISGADDSNLWARDYTLPWSDIFAVQDQVSQSVVENIDVVLQPGEQQALVDRHRTTDIVAYEAFNKGLYSARKYENLRGLEYFAQAERFLTEALETDPRYLEALVLLGVLYEERFEAEQDPAWLSKSEELLSRALEQDPTHGLALSRMSWVAYHNEDVDRYFELASKALESSPSLSEPHNSLASFYWVMGFYESAFAEYRIALCRRTVCF